jgi:seryl-tRNA(Sec) selenium transferase
MNGYRIGRQIGSFFSEFFRRQIVRRSAGGNYRWKGQYISLMQKYPLYRAIRPDKMNLCAIEQTLLAHLKNPEKIRLHEIFKADIETLRARAIAICAELGDHLVSHGPMKSVAGGGSTPAIDFDGYGLTVKANIPDLEKKLRLNDPQLSYGP